MRESTIERYLVTRVRAAGGDAWKVAPTTAGIPDRLVLLPGGKVLLVELKAPNGRLSRVQQVWHDRAEAKGTHVYVLYSKEQVDQFMEDQCPTASR